jgi:hypothetical protein
MFRPYPISLLQFGIFWGIALVGAVALIRALAKSSDRAGAAKRSGLAAAAVALQVIGQELERRRPNAIGSSAGA